MTQPHPRQPRAMDAHVFCVSTIEIVRTNVPTLVTNLAATDDLIADIPRVARDRLRPHIVDLVATGLTLGRRLLRAVDLALHVLTARAEDLGEETAADVRDELLGLADELAELLVRLSCVEAHFDRVD